MNKNKGYIIGLSSGMFWSIAMTFSSYVFSAYGISPITIAIFNDVFGFLMLVLFFTYKYKNIPLHIFKNAKNYAVVLGAILAGPIGMVCYNYAISSIGSSITASITATYPAFALVFSILLLKKKFTFRIYLAIFIIVISLIIQNYNPGSSNFVVMGLITALISAMAWGSESVLTSFAMMDELSEYEAIFLRQCTSILAYGLIIMPFSFNKVVSDINMKVVPFIFLIALFNLLSYIAYYKTINDIDVPTATGLNSSYVIFAPILSFLFLKENISLKVAIMSVFILMGLIIIFSNANREKNKDVY